jgi:hypothetical protein
VLRQVEIPGSKGLPTRHNLMKGKALEPRQVTTFAAVPSFGKRRQQHPLGHALLNPDQGQKRAGQKIARMEL